MLPHKQAVVCMDLLRHDHLGVAIVVRQSVTKSIEGDRGGRRALLVLPASVAMNGSIEMMMLGYMVVGLLGRKGGFVRV